MVRRKSQQFPNVVIVVLIPFSLLSHLTQAFTLITFDVDGTLVKGTGAAEYSAHSRAFAHAIQTVFSTPTEIPPPGEILPRHLYHGSTDGLILLRLARAAAQIEPGESFPKLDQLMNTMFDYVNALPDSEVAAGIEPLPGALETLRQLASMPKDVVRCGLVTGNVEGIAVRKMGAVGVVATGALAPPSPQQARNNNNGGLTSFLGGFGSDYCSGNIDDLDRNFLDRAEQIRIAVERCPPGLQRVVHVGDAPADVLAAKAFAQKKLYTVGMVATATGSYSADALRELAGEPVPGVWEPVVLEHGLADPGFIGACGVDQASS